MYADVRVFASTTHCSFDKDGSGYITEQELVEALREHHMPEQQLQELLADVDRDGDDKIDYDEVRGGVLWPGVASLTPVEAPCGGEDAGQCAKSAQQIMSIKNHCLP